MKHIISLLAVSVLLSSCGDKEVSEKNADNFNNPETVGTLVDGRVVKRIELRRPGLQSPHWIYYVDQVSGGTTISENHSISNGSNGKRSSTKTVVYIDGVTYERK